jgi:2-amino-4-hydroxy-6-hydroxymethyldihydropteridine diphosphokinase
MRVRSVLSLGANLGDRQRNLDGAISLIAAHPDCELIAASDSYESAALTLAGVDEQAPRYLNRTVIVETSLKPKSLLRFLQQIEKHFGRERSIRWASRTLDIDIISFGDLQLTGNLEIPHPRAHERAFVLLPWLEVDPEAEIAGRGKVADLAIELHGQAWPYEQ